MPTSKADFRVASGVKQGKITQTTQGCSATGDRVSRKLFYALMWRNPVFPGSRGEVKVLLL